MTFLSFIKDILSSRKGHSLLFLAFTAPPLIFFWSLLLDESKLINQEISSQTIADAAALSASSYYDDHYYDVCPIGTNNLQTEAEERAATIQQAARTNSDVQLSSVTTAKTESYLRVRVLAKAQSVGILSKFVENTTISDATSKKLYHLSNDDLNLLTDAPQTLCYTSPMTCPPGEHVQCTGQGNCACTDTCRGGGVCNVITGLCEGGHDDGLECDVPGGGGLICKNPGTCVNGVCDKGKDKNKACVGPL